MPGAQGPTPHPTVRQPAVAGTFYPADADRCRQMAATFVRPTPETVDAAGSKRWIGGIVPHAGWICSAAVAGQTLAAIGTRDEVDLVVVFGAVHTPVALEGAALDTHDTWLVPGSAAALPTELQQKLATSAGALFQYRADLHRHEHAVEVEVPLIQQMWPRAMLLPIEVPLIDEAIEIGVRTARQVAVMNVRAIFLASSDLTHYGPNYGLVEAGVGEQGIRWAFDNDRRLLDRVSRYELDAIVPEVRDRLNACGGGAIAAMMAAAREFGATEGRVLRQTNSYETLAAVAPQPPTNAVGYAAVVVG